jgi:hypothetical protein
MPEPTAYEIVIRGRASARLLRPLLDDFTFDRSCEGVTRLLGDIGDPSHLHGVLAHLTSVNAEVISIGPVPASEATSPADPSPTTTHEPSRSTQP